MPIENNWSRPFIYVRDSDRALLVQCEQHAGFGVAQMIDQTVMQAAGARARDATMLELTP